MKLIDSFGRQINYLRLSVTDRCNLRCKYCMSEDGVAACQHNDILPYESLHLIAQAAVSMGIEKIRVTGGEPLVRNGIVPFLARLSAIDGLRHLAISTNGILLPEMAQDLFQAGVQRLNISMDSLQEDKYRQITHGGDLKKVFAGLKAAEKAGFPPPKINVVAMRGFNDDEIFDFTEMTRDYGYSVRFIEYMPTLDLVDWQKQVISGQEILDRISSKYQLEEVEKGPFAGPSKDYRIAGAQGSIGIITAVSGHFCATCNRIRITSTGKAKSCLFSNHEIDLAPLLRNHNQVGVRRKLEELVENKPQCHALSIDGYEHENFLMSQVGG
ncbi:GTP 3',8-cyclase MoaA [Desulfuromonas acetoxidans]|uniref:GTP 3',8-cyclase n=1 Tax=Desulfuromonas acetoxidans (strain DSM 684 / 11070) TaxID=281689 RepID=Q1K2J3_DESA6|nr:GTP 3',8-cyclase MoaA [Desulfuromonas acetoxidans]EAT16888.1 molybdenum cofactor synthesis-like [Desulfuromonas acetoxidans DSM 684]MBF0645518.1 GTP 3',8-cyclase MoaA [Desulfuromonas acetoxidans]NVD23834.1 GTP 3',8-cyclase MoaA [Desulfuromonas acetoxidans]NVE15769.1 GTP 3',8-cyclase MoaA [Desulfuromonas acetoxidans]